MTALLQIPLENGASILVEEVQSAPTGPVRAGRGERVIHETAKTLESYLATVKEACAAVVDQLKGVAADEMSAEFGVTLTAEAGAVIAKTSAECHLTVTLTWKGDRSTP